MGAVQEGHIGAVQMLIECGANLFVRDVSVDVQVCVLEALSLVCRAPIQ